MSEKEKNEMILYQSPNANSNLQTLLQTSLYSANEIDKKNITKNHIKSQSRANKPKSKQNDFENQL